MILPDVNVLVYAIHTDSPLHERARKWLEPALVGNEGIVMWDVTLISAFRVLTNPKMGLANAGTQEILDALDGIRTAPACLPAPEDARLWQTFQKVALASGARGPLASDAMLAALALEHRYRLATFDKDFARFQGLSWFTP